MSIKPSFDYDRVTLIGGPSHGERRNVARGMNIIRFHPRQPIPIRPSFEAVTQMEQVATVDYVRSRMNRELFLFDRAGERATDHYCKHCESSYPIDIPPTYTGDVIITCPVCDAEHFRNFERGIATGCNTPQGRYLSVTISGAARPRSLRWSPNTDRRQPCPR